MQKDEELDIIGKDNGANIVGRMLVYIDTKDITITDLAQKLNVSREHLSRIFNRKIAPSRRIINKFKAYLYGVADNIEWQ